MTRFIYDQFAKDYLEELLSILGEVQAPREVRGEVRQIDVWFVPQPEKQANAEVLGLLGRLATTPALFEPFRNPATPDEICSCLLKLLQVRGESQREAHRNKTRISEADYPKLWILTPTASEATLNGFRAILDESNPIAGIYFLADYLRSAIVVIHQLPRTPETLWLRLLGRGKVQKQAIDEIAALPVNNPFRYNALLLLSSLRSNLEVNSDLDPEDRELVMRLSPLLSEQLQTTLQQGIEQGIKRERRELIENFLRVRFGTIDESLQAIIEPLVSLSPPEFLPLLIQLSREELLARFANQN